MDAFVRDLRYALRQLRLSPSYAALAIISIGVGIGATTTIFSLVEALLLKPVPATRADRLIYGYETSPDGSRFHSFSFLQYKDLRERSRTLTDLAAFDITPLSVATTGDVQLSVGFNVSGNFFKTFGATPELGRFFLREEDAYPDVGSHPVAVVSHAFWERRLAGDTSAVGRTIRVNGRAFTVVGVARPEMSSVLSFIKADLWTPIAMSAVTKPDLRLDSRDYSTFQVVGRLADGVSRQSAERELEAIAKQIEADHPEMTKGHGVDLVPVFRDAGVTADTKVRSLAETPRFVAYLPIGQSHVQEISAMIRGDVTTAASAARTTLRAIDPDLPLMNNSTFEQYTSVALLPQRLAGVVSATLGLAGLLLAAIGVYGIVAYAVSQRTREIGIRVAVGATPGGVARFMAGEGVRVAAIGIAIGLALALGGAQLMRSFLLGMNPYDPIAFGGAAAGLLGVAAVACVVPARRAAKVDPIVALKAE